MASRELRRCRESHNDGDGTPRIVRGGPSGLNGASHPASGTRLRRAVDPGASTAPAGLTARARPKARPKERATNLPYTGNQSIGSTC